MQGATLALLAQPLWHMPRALIHTFQRACIQHSYTSINKAFANKRAARCQEVRVPVRARVRGVCVCACVRACVRACVCACVRASAEGRGRAPP